MVDHIQSAVISASCLPMSIIIVGVGHEDFKVDLPILLVVWFDRCCWWFLPMLLVVWFGLVDDKSHEESPTLIVKTNF